MVLENTLRPFHLAFPVHDLNQARQFYGELLGCPEGRSSDQWIDFIMRLSSKRLRILIPYLQNDDS